ncbi:efflux RND transporter periplasmic adaptor subunit [Parvularcula sp. ZS-1/3]|uniref:Efflux RND transporter periplasmic adaptor subunit n=1 Tax=Parvularcula mediterranea TaxID=2732508 RepID=A0A7Y3RL11_9PROT|nr:efflux RND transporter periplasmic adaptor subunit [Parvularcula mediterranea]NNU15955.1 efflux RND transporter periplasmic adaptor subunit [Parvularcula mediterranea]
MPFRERHIKHFTTLASIKKPRIFTAVAIILVVTITATIAFLTMTPWVQTTSGPGIVTTLDPNDRQQEINALVSGRIERWYVRDGARVKKGDPILKVADNDPQLLERLDAEQQQLLEQRNAAASALATARIDLERTQRLFEDGLAARRDYEQATIRVEGLRADLAAAEAALTRQQVDISRQSLQLIRAPRDGTILRLNAGDVATTISAGSAVATFQPDGAKRAVELFIDGRDVALVKPGDDVRLLFEGWPAVQFSGWPSVAVGTFEARVLTIDPTAQPNGQFRVLVTEVDNPEVPWPDQRFIRYGATVRGWILLETVPLGFELWRQLNNFPPEFTGEASSDGFAPQ